MSRITKITMLLLISFWCNLANKLWANSPSTLTVDCPKNITLNEGGAFDTTITGVPKILVNTGGKVTVSILEVYQKGNCSNQTDQVIRNFTLTNESGEQARCSQTIFLRHIKANSIYVPRDTSIEHPDSTVSLTAKLLKIPTTLASVSISWSDVKISTNCNNPVKIRRTWAIRDICTGVVTNPVTTMDVYFYQLSFKHFSSISDGVCNAEGFIQLNPIGEFIPYTYLWSTGAKTSNIAQQTPGTYTVTITDNNQCSQIRIYSLIPMATRADIGGRIITDNGIRITPDSIIFGDQNLYSKICLSTNGGIHYGYNLKRKTPGTYVYSFVKNSQLLDGLSTKDIILIQRHILNIAKFRDTLQYIAADVNINFGITASDMAEIRGLILGKKEKFTVAKPWYFLRPDWRMVAKPNQPISNIEFKGVTISNFPRQNVDVFALKMGDIDLSFDNLTGNHAEVRSSQESAVEVHASVPIHNGTNRIVPVYFTKKESVLGIQFSMSVAHGKIIGVRTTSFPKESYFIDDGIFNLSWSTGLPLEWNEKQAVVEFIVESTENKIDFIGDPRINAECYTTNFETKEIDIVNYNYKGFTQNEGLIYPNPNGGILYFKQALQSIQIFDALGKEWLLHSENYFTRLHLPTIIPVGIYFYTAKILDGEKVNGTFFFDKP